MLINIATRVIENKEINVDEAVQRGFIKTWMVVNSLISSSLKTKRQRHS